MALVETRHTSDEDFLKLREETDDKKICFKVAKILDGYVADKSCQMLQGVNIRLYDEQKTKIGDVIPDFSVFCQYKDLDSTFIEYIPTIEIEIVSPPTVYADNIKTYIKELVYKNIWIIDPKSKVITVWNFNTDE